MTESDLMNYLQLLLGDLEHTEKYTEALKLCRELYILSRAKELPEDEAIRAIERRLPKPHKELAEAASLRINKVAENNPLVITRPIGELEGRIIYVTQTPEGVHFGSVKVEGNNLEIPAWDITAPKTRRSIEA